MTMDLWPGSRLAQARSLARHSTRRLAGWLGVAHSTVQRQERRERLTRYMQRRLCDNVRIYALYHGLTDKE
jgi:IS30 family transposase